jgi:hypothetical protein
MPCVGRALAALTWVLLAGCASAAPLTTSGPDSTGASELTRVGQAVQLTQSAMRARECQFIVDVPVSSSDPTDAEAMVTLRNDAGAAGANLVLLVMATRTTIERAEGYLCADE